MKVVVMEIPSEESEDGLNSLNHLTLLSDHTNGYCYEIANLRVPVTREELNKQALQVMSDFRYKHMPMALRNLNVSEEVYARVIKSQLKDYSEESLPHIIFSRMYMNIRKSKSQIERIIVQPTSLLQLEAGLRSS